MTFDQIKPGMLLRIVAPDDSAYEVFVVAPTLDEPGFTVIEVDDYLIWDMGVPGVDAVKSMEEIHPIGSNEHRLMMLDVLAVAHSRIELFAKMAHIATINFIKPIAIE